MSEPSSNTEIIAFSSGKGGTGKTLLTISLAFALRTSGHRVLLIDSDTGTDGLTLFLLGAKGIQTIKNVRLEETFTGFLKNYIDEGVLRYKARNMFREEISRPEIDLPKGTEIDVEYPTLISGLNPFGEQITSSGPVPELNREDYQRAVGALFEDIRSGGDFDYVLVDTRGGFAFESSDVCAISDSFIIVTEPDRTSFYQDHNLVNHIFAAAEATSRKPVLRAVVVNKARVGIDGRPENIEREFRTQLSGGLPIEYSETFAIPLDVEAVDAHRVHELPYVFAPASKYSTHTIRAFHDILGIVTAEWSSHRRAGWRTLVGYIEAAVKKEKAQRRRKQLAKVFVATSLIAIVVVAIGLSFRQIVLDRERSQELSRELRYREFSLQRDLEEARSRANRADSLSIQAQRFGTEAQVSTRELELLGEQLASQVAIAATADRIRRQADSLASNLALAQFEISKLKEDAVSAKEMIGRRDSLIRSLTVEEDQGKMVQEQLALLLSTEMSPSLRLRSLQTLLEAGYRSFPFADFSNLDLSGLDLSDSDLNRASLINANLTGTKLTNALLQDANLSGALLLMADLNNTHLYGAQLGEADARGTDFRGALGLTYSQLSVVASLEAAWIDPVLRKKITSQKSDLIRQSKEREDVPVSLYLEAEKLVFDIAPDKSTAHIDRLLSVFREDASLYKLRALARRNGGDEESALSDISKAIRLQPNNEDYLVKRAVINLKFGNTQAARFDAFSDDLTGTRSVNQLRALLYIVLGDETAALDYTQRAMELTLTPSVKAGILENMGILLAKKGRWKEAFDNTERVLELTDTLAWNWLIRAIAANRLGLGAEEDEALSQWRSTQKRFTLVGLGYAPHFSNRLTG